MSEQEIGDAGTEIPVAIANLDLNSNHDETVDIRPRHPLDASLYSLDENEKAFYKSQTGITDDDELKEHILKAQAEAYAVHPYPCIRRFAFAKLKISRFPAYQNLLRLGKERPGALFLDIGCCFGNDIRKAVADGYPIDQVIGSDLRPEYWDLGHKLFRTTPETFNAAFVPGDALSEEFLKWEPFRDTPLTTPAPDLRTLKTLTPLSGRLSAIHASSFFHLFPEATQFRLAQLTSSLLSPEPGSMIFGGHVGASEKGVRERHTTNAAVTRRPMFCHSPESWTEMWEKEIFKGQNVKAWAILHDVSRERLPDETEKVSLLIWSVTRLGPEGTFDPNPRLPLDPGYYSLDQDESDFFKSQTGITDDNELKDHIIQVQTEAYAVHPYTCIRRFSFTRLKISRFPAYQDLLKLGKERPGALFLDIGCCFGNDIRKAVADGFPIGQVIASDLRPEFWDLGHKLFRTTQEKFPAKFIAGDALSEDFLKWEPLRDTPLTSPAPDISTLSTLTPLNGRLSAIHASSFFHLFHEATQFRLAHLLSSLLSPEPGSIIFGAHVGAKEKGFRDRSNPDPALNKRPIFCHSPESWKQLWEEEIFKDQKVKVFAILHEATTQHLSGLSDIRNTLLVWSVTRL